MHTYVMHAYIYGKVKSVRKGGTICYPVDDFLLMKLVVLHLSCV